MGRRKDPQARSALIAAARREFVRRGIQGARVEDITARSGLSKGSFYLHFGSKEALFSELVKDFSATFHQLTSERKAALKAQLQKRPVPSRSVEQLERDFDHRALELMWIWRDVFQVLFRGTQGTAFEGVIWKLVSDELARVQRDCQMLKRWGGCRRDVPNAIVGTMVVGTYLLLALQMSKTRVKPKLGSWVPALRKLFREGMASGNEFSNTMKKVEKYT